MMRPEGGSPSGKARIGAALAAAAAIALAGGTAIAWDWPQSPPRLAATFGTFAKGRVITGVALAAEDGLVRSAEGGDLAFALEEGELAGILPCPLGTFAIVEQDKGMAAVYSHLARGSLASYLRKPAAGDILGRTGSTGWVEGAGTMFQVFDRQTGSWVNPLLVLPPLADDKPPLIRSLALSRGDKTYVLGPAASVPQGTYTVSVDAADPADSDWTAGPLAPYVIRLSIDGAETAKFVFDQAKGEGGKLMLFSTFPASADGLRTAEGRYILAERLFTRGRESLEVRVEDAAGNKRSASWTLSVE
jgi:hypothetical protein